MIARQPALRRRCVIVLLEVELVGRGDPSARVGQIDLDDAQARRVAGSVDDVDALGELDVRAVHGLPVQVEAHDVLGEIDAFHGEGAASVHDRRCGCGGSDAP